MECPFRHKFVVVHLFVLLSSWVGAGQTDGFALSQSPTNETTDAVDLERLHVGSNYFPIEHTLIGTQAFSANYSFDMSRTSLVEQAEVIREAGFEMFKFGIGRKAFGDYELYRSWEKSWYDLPSMRSYKNLSDMVAREPSVRYVLDMDFKIFCMWTYGFFGSDFRFHGQQAYDEIYNLTKDLLTRYNNSGKVFLLGHWEGDWSLIPNYDPSIKRISGKKRRDYIAWIKNRQKAVEDARKNTPHENVWVAHYLEVNRVSDYIDFGRERIVNSILPKTTIDAVSYSVYDAGMANLQRNLQAIEDSSNFTDYLNGVFKKKVFIGEFGFSLRNSEGKIIRSPEKQKELGMEILDQANDWGVPIAFYWQLFNNERCDNGDEAGWWLIDNNNEKQPIYYEFVKYLGKQ